MPGVVSGSSWDSILTLLRTTGRIALFNLPALEIDTDVDGLFVIRGVTFSLSSFTLVAHGIELGLKLTDDIELAMYVDEVVVQFFRSIDVGDVYANVKGGKFEMTLGDLDLTADDDASSETSVFLDDTPLLRAATAGSRGFTDRPMLRESLTGGVKTMRDSSAQAGFNMVESLSPDDNIADKQYHERLTEIRTTSAVYQSRQQVRQKAKGENGFKFDNENDMRAAVSAELHKLPSIPHPPNRSVRVTTLQTLAPPYVRSFLHRLPFLLRLLLAPLSYFHPISISSITGNGSGQWLSALLQQQVFKHHTEHNAELRRIHRRISHWLADANFCMQFTDVSGLGQVPLSTLFDIVAYLKFSDVMAYRTEPEKNTIRQVVRLGGADATFTIPSYLLPHHEHIIPAEPTPQEEHELRIEVEQADGLPHEVQKEKELEKLQKDETNITMSVHASLPLSCDQTVLNFVAALVKATKMIEAEKEVEVIEQTSGKEQETPASPLSRSSTADNDKDSLRSRSDSKDASGFKTFAKNIRQNLKDGTTGTQIKEFAKELHQNTKDGLEKTKRTMVAGMVNDRWIAKIVGKTAAMLQKAQGDVGYSGGIPVPLAPYRGSASLPSKILP
ncbi:hypothetical protein CLAFUW4_14003 [Fulvia fulva]|uniref:Uncharacterized protein n=1 Tax=Passalora fulva TaxID=5499 RepID=A0A9Q8UW05_PASFU|nr:uncharacterized protein CLAFUR5_13842 [Fulvia fulva]KAK4610571.1 hypothetical protein CLAFUR4_14006 [Fulvia fulva]KAK4611453.1 hypothetical protein CLAFUR0_14010 [Fulvia fulva]UJO24521.1 hypothetical protein CLAFUR5_13842 [Fulvia fulva]WPV22104.1 hypothetical protein CLAFUW4_14003 [Fulvia fulva]WPV37000.1 hypothetical protein CLAFUW7_14012 [Fulvia fulva]